MKLFEYRLLDIVVIKDEKTIFEGKSEDLPEEYRMYDTKSVVLESGKAIIKV